MNELKIFENQDFGQVRTVVRDGAPWFVAADVCRDGYLINKPGGDYNSPTQRSMELGIMRVDEVSIAKSDGNVILRRTPKITGKGQIYFMTRYGRG